MKNWIKLLLALFIISSVLLVACKTPLEQYLDRGTKYFDQGKWDEAIAAYTQAIELDPNNVLAYTNRGASYVEKGEYAKGIEDYNKAIELDPENIIIYYNRSMAYIYNGDYDKAIADCNKIIEGGLKNNWVYFNRGVAYAKKGMYEFALADFYKAKSLVNAPEFTSKVDEYIKQMNDAIKLQSENVVK